MFELSQAGTQDGPALRPLPGRAPIDPRSLLTAIAEVVYDWAIDTDRLTWGPNVGEVLKLPVDGAPATGEGFARLLDPDAASSRFEALVHADGHDEGEGVAYQIHYALLPHRRNRDFRLWIEETGRWFAGPTGRPQRAHGVMRVIDARHAVEPGASSMPRSGDLAGPMSRPQLMRALAEAIVEAQRQRHATAFLLAGLDSPGTAEAARDPAVADEAMAMAIRRIRAHLHGGDVLGRVSTNTLGIVLSRCEASDLPVAARRFIDAVAGLRIATRVGPAPLRISAGGVLAPRQAETAAEAVNRAQQALDRCRTGGHGFLAFSAVAARAEDGFADEVLAALNDRRIVLAMEPALQATNRRPAFHVCRPCLQRPDGTLVPVRPTPDLATLVHHRVTELATDELRRNADIRLVLDLPVDTDPGWLRAFAVMLHQHRAAQRLTVIVDERDVAADPRTADRLFGELKERGVRIGIGGFGAGHLPPQRLRSLGADRVGIDGAFVQAMTRSADDRFLVRTLIGLAHDLGLEVAADWVSDETTAAQLAAWGCDYLQGSVAAQAVPARPGRAAGRPVPKRPSVASR